MTKTECSFEHSLCKKSQGKAANVQKSWQLFFLFLLAVNTMEFLLGKQKPIKGGVSTDSPRVMGLTTVEVEDGKIIS